MSIHVSMHMSMHMSTHMSTHISMHMSTHMCTSKADKPSDCLPSSCYARRHACARAPCERAHAHACTHQLKHIDRWANYFSRVYFVTRDDGMRAVVKHTPVLVWACAVALV